VADLHRMVQRQGARYRPWTRTALEGETLDQALWSALWEALQTHPPKAVQALEGGRVRESGPVNPPGRSP
jgi:hypothetical protein